MQVTKAMPFETLQVVIDDQQELVTSIELDKEDQNNKMKFLKYQQKLWIQQMCNQ